LFNLKRTHCLSFKKEYFVKDEDWYCCSPCNCGFCLCLHWPHDGYPCYQAQGCPQKGTFCQEGRTPEGRSKGCPQKGTFRQEGCTQEGRSKGRPSKESPPSCKLKSTSYFLSFPHFCKILFENKLFLTLPYPYQNWFSLPDTPVSLIRPVLSKLAESPVVEIRDHKTSGLFQISLTPSSKKSATLPSMLQLPPHVSQRPKSSFTKMVLLNLNVHKRPPSHFSLPDLPRAK